MLKKLLIIICLPVLAFGQAELIDPSEMPFGGFSSIGANDTIWFSADDLKFMRDVLGINQLSASKFNPEVGRKFSSAGIYMYPYDVYWDKASRKNIFEPQYFYGNSTYFVCQPEDSELYNIKFEAMEGFIYHDSLWACAENTTMLGNLRLKLLNTNKLERGSQHKYYSYIRLGIDPTMKHDGDMIVGTFRATDISTRPRKTLLKSTIRVNDLKGDSITTHFHLTDDSDDAPFFTILDEVKSAKHWIKFDFESAGNCTVYVDYFQINCQYGAKLANRDPTVANQIKGSAGRRAFQGKILDWFVKDSPRPRNLMAVGYIDSLIQQAMIDSNWTESLKVGAVSWPCAICGNQTGDIYRDLVLHSQPEVLWAYLYPIDLKTDYTGYGARGLQHRLNSLVAEPCDSIRAVMADSVNIETVPEWWMYGPQYWWCDPNDDEYPCFSGEDRREPTRAELRCLTSIGLCYQPKGIMFWQYSAIENRWQGLVNSDRSLTNIGDAVRTDINPYIKAIDSLYLGLEWESAYALTPESSGDWISHIDTSPNSSESNPDLGWFHVGQFYDNSGDKYVMIVNRACSRDELGAEAPTITARVRFNRDDIGSNSAFIIDLAKGTNADDWVGYPDTTFTAVVADGTIPYSATLKAGEGRLYKIVPLDY
ncbi:MAG: hypothetical protein GY839_05185 [candidate division Zixibacteria bacterium]|nr:hypothetical protein [candidate division Zixibacteria bacterium]